MDNDKTIHLAVPDNDRTIHMAMPQQAEDIDRTAPVGRAQVQNTQTVRPAARPFGTYPAAEGEFTIKGEVYKNERILSDNSGEAQVYLVSHDNQQYVLKVYYPNFTLDKDLMKMVCSFNFEMLVRVVDFGKTYVNGKHRNYELMEFLSGGSLQDYKLDHNINEFRRIALQAAAALEYCHSNHILHKDIKPSNYLFRNKDHKELVLTDFGISTKLEGDRKSVRTMQARTPIYAAPEMYIDVIDGEVELTPAADFYSLGITLLTLWLGENPFSSNERDMMRQKNEGRLPHMDELPPLVKRIIQGLTAVNATTRWRYDQVERWFKGEEVPVDISSPFLRYKSFIVDPDRNLVADNVQELVPLLVENEKLATNYLYNGRIVTWLESCGNTKLSALVKDIIVNRYPVDQRAGLMASVYAMDPNYPYYDLEGSACDDVHSIAMSLLSFRERYGLTLQNPNDTLFLWLESRTKCNISRLRSYFEKEEGQPFNASVAVLRLVYEIDTEIPFLVRLPSATVKDIVSSFGTGKVTEDDWKALCDGRLLSWMYSHEDIIACESLRILTQDQPYSKVLGYKVLYNLDRMIGYDLGDADTPEKIGALLNERLMSVQHASADDFVHEMDDFINPNGRFAYYAELHGWAEIKSEQQRNFDMHSEENKDRLGAYDFKTAVYRFCRLLGVVPSYRLADGTVLTDGRNISLGSKTQIHNEMRRGSFNQWMSVFFHEDPTRDFEEPYSYERELESWVLELGSYDIAQPYYKRYVEARDETAERIDIVRRQWRNLTIRQNFWSKGFYVLSAIWMLLVLVFGISDHTYVLEHWGVCFMPLALMTGFIVAIRAYFKGFGPLMAILFGLLGMSTTFIPYYILSFVERTMPSMFSVAIVLLTLVYVAACRFTDFRNDTKADNSLINQVLDDDVKSTLLEPLYYTFKMKSYRYKGSKFSMLDEVTDQVNAVSGESILHYVLWCLLMLVMIVQFSLLNPKLVGVKKPYTYNMENTTQGAQSVSEPMEEIE